MATIHSASQTKPAAPVFYLPCISEQERSRPGGQNHSGYITTVLPTFQSWLGRASGKQLVFLFLEDSLGDSECDSHSPIPLTSSCRVQNPFQLGYQMLSDTWSLRHWDKVCPTW